MLYDAFCDHHVVSRETFDRLKQYHSLLIKWQSHINLISPNTIPDIWSRHILDCCQLYSLIEHKDDVVVDMGSGAGLPGLILAILGCSQMHLIESDLRKTQFLKEASRELGLSTTIHHGRIESVRIDSVRTITARALKPLPQLLAWAHPLTAANTICLFPKGKNYATEMEDARKSWHFESLIQPNTVDNSGIVLIVKQIKPR